MIGNYSSRYSSLTWQQKSLSRPLSRRQRNTHVRKEQGNNLLLKTVGGMLLAVLTLGVGTSCWYGMQVRMALDEIGKSTLTKQELIIQQKALSTQRDILLQRENMEKAASKIGLYVPTKEQLR
jgi:uncharacterized protein HemX